MLSDKEIALKERISAVYSMLEQGKLSFEDPENKTTLNAAIDEVYKEVYSGTHKDFNDIDSKFGALQSVNYHIDDYISFHTKREEPIVQAGSNQATPIYEGQKGTTEKTLTGIIDNEPDLPSQTHTPGNVYAFPGSKKEKQTYGSGTYNTIKNGVKRLKMAVAVGVAAVLAAGIMYACKPEAPNHITSTPKHIVQTYEKEAIPEALKPAPITVDNHHGTMKDEIQEGRFKRLCLDNIDMDEAKKAIDMYGPSGLAWTLTGEYPVMACEDNKKNVTLLKALQASDWYTGIYKKDSDTLNCKGKGKDGLWDRLKKRDTKDLLERIIIPESAYDLIIKEYLEPSEKVKKPDIDTSGFTTMESIVFEQAQRSAQ